MQLFCHAVTIAMLLCDCITGSDDGSVRFWEVSTGRCMKSITMETGSLGNMCIRSVTWNPHPDVSLVAIAM